MASMGMQMLASALCLLGWVGVIITCIMPMWKVTAFVGSTIITSQTFWEGIWMSCVVESTGVIQCKPYYSLLELGADLQVARAFTLLAIVVGGVGLILAFVGGKCTRFLDEEGGGVKGKLAVAAGAVLIATGVLCFIPTSWTAGVVVSSFYSISVDAQKREIGACLYIGWGASILLCLGGCLFISSACPLKANGDDKSPSVRYLVVRSSNGSNKTGSQRSGARPWPASAMVSRAHSYEGVSTKPPQYTRPPWEDEPAQSMRQESERSWAPSTKSQMKRPESDQSEAPSTKSQLRQAESLSVKSDNEEASSNAARTYI